MAVNRDTEEMLASLKLDSVNELFEDIPEAARTKITKIEKGLTEPQVRARLERILGKNIGLKETSSFLGGGAYDFYIPAAVKNIVGRSEFITSYTPYQPEISQGLLQALFEYQSMMCELSGMEVVNNSLYDYATGLGEAALMAARIQKKSKIFLIPENLPESRKSVMRNYCRGAGLEFQEYAMDRTTGALDMNDLAGKISDNTIGALVETPNYYGVLEPAMGEIRKLLENKMLVVGANALSMAVVQPPGSYGADIMIAEGQQLGNPVNFGGPMLGIMGCKKQHIRKMPGRVIGLTHDAEGNRAFCMTLQTREQHIRREKATSNICSNEALTTVATASYLAYMGGSGLRRMAVELIGTARQLASSIDELPGCQAPAFTGTHFNEFVVRLPRPAKEIIAELSRNGVNAGLELEGAGNENCLLVTVTDTTTPDDIGKLTSSLRGVCK